MKYKSALMTAASGSLGGITASHNRGGQYFRARVTPTDPATCRQKEQRAIMSALSHAYAQMTPELRQDWAEYAANVPYTPAFCGPINLTGQQWFIKLLSPRIKAGQSLIYQAPTEYSMATPPTTLNTFSYEPITEVVTLSVSAEELLPIGTFLHIYQGRPISPSKNFYDGPYQYATSLQITGSPSMTFTYDGPLANWQSDYTMNLDSKTPLRMYTQAPDLRVSPDFACPETPSEGTTGA